MTFDQRVEAVAKKGFTARQARFLATVMLHAGVCVPRQYARFCGIVHGQKTRKFFARLVSLRYASMYDCRHNRARVYHINQRALYGAIGEADNRLRRPLTLNHAIHRLMILDAIVEDPDLIWLGTAEEKTVHLTALTQIDPAKLPHVAVGEGDARRTRYFPERLPIGIHLAGRGLIVYVVTDRSLDEFRVFLERHAAMLRALPAWTLRIVIPPNIQDIGQRAKQVVWNQLMTPLRPPIIEAAPSRCDDIDERFYKARAAFSARPVQGAVQDLEAGWRRSARRPRIPRDRRRGDCGIRAGRDSGTRSSVRSSLSPGRRRLSRRHAGQRSIVGG